MDFLFEYDNMIVLSKIVGQGSQIIAAIGIVVSFAIAFLKNKEGKNNKGAISIGVFLIAILIGLCILSFKGTFNMEVVKYYSSHGTYFGQVKGEEAHGKGRYYDEDGNIIYEGEFKNNKYEGNGRWYIVKSKNGKTRSVLSYEGEFKEDKYEGKGCTYWTSGERIGKACYKGEFHNGDYNGKGTIYYEDGTTYKGGFAEDQKCGYGEESFIGEDDEDIFCKGTFIAGKLNGYAEMYVDGNIRYKGEFVNGEKEGYGKLYYDNEYLEYEGKFAHGEKNGEGTMYSEENENEIVTEGIWEDGELISEQ